MKYPANRGVRHSNRLGALMSGPVYPPGWSSFRKSQTLERGGSFHQWLLNSESLNARTQLYSMAVGVIEHVLPIHRINESRTVREKDHVRLNLLGNLIIVLAKPRHLLQGTTCGVAGRSALGDSGVEYENIGGSFSH